MNTNYNIHNLISVSVDQKIKPWVLDQIEFQIGYFKVDYDYNSKYNITIYPYEELTQSKKELAKFHDFSFDSGKSLIEDKKSFAIIKRDNGFDIFTDKPILINIFIQILLNKDISFVHAAAIKKPNGGVILMPGAGGVGKTAIVGSMVKKNGYKLLGDDLILLEKTGKCFAFPRPFILKDYHRNVYPDIFEELKLGKNSLLDFRKILKFLIKNAPFFDFIKKELIKLKLYNNVVFNIPKAEDFLAAVPIQKILGDNCIELSGEIEKIIFLERYSGEEFRLEKIEERSLSNRMFSIIHHEFADYIKEFFVIGSSELLDINHYFDKTFDTIKSAIRNKDCKKLYIPQRSSSEDLYNYFNKII